MLRRSFVQSASAFGVAMAGSQVLAQTNEIKELRFGIISTESQANQKPLWEPFIEAMSKGIGLPIKAFYATQYAGIIEAMKFKQVEMAWFGGKSYIEAARMANAEAFAQTVASNGEMGYLAHLIMNSENPKAKAAKAMGGDKYVLANAKDLTFAFNDPNSTSGYLVPYYYIFAQNDVNPKQAFKQLIFSGSHEATALAVANNQVDVATNNSESLERLKTTNPEAAKKIEIVWTSSTIPSDPIAYRKDLPDDLKKKIRDFMFAYSDPAILKPLQWSKFIPADDKKWNTIRELEFGKQLIEAQNSDTMSAEDKAKKVADLKKQLDAVKSK